MSKKYKNCQSCGMPLKKDNNGGGSESNGTINTMYCSFCYSDGKFIQADWTLVQMQVLVKEKLKEIGFPGFLAGFFSKGISKLERWK
jgi:hypothetical protein